jgi:hypothetical protein
MDNHCEKKTRGLYAWEVEEARKVFGNSLRYEDVRVHECATWTDATDRFGRWLKRLPPPGPSEHNAITLGNGLNFPINMAVDSPPDGGSELWKLYWMMHELTHAWQFQHQGWIYLAKALYAQFTLGPKAYDFGGPEGLIARRQENKTITFFNLEQQGDIAQGYYICLRQGRDPSAFLPYIQDIQAMT